MTLRPNVLRVLLGALALLGLGAVALSLLNVYSVRNPYEPFVAGAREFLQAALARDSQRLVRVPAASGAVQWALDTGRRHPAVLRDLLRDLRVGGGRRLGEETFVFFHGWTFGICVNRPLAITFTGEPPAARILDASTDCVAAP